MTTYIAMLRGINVSGQKKIRMQDLRTWLDSSELSQVRTYIQSGNVVFQSTLTAETKLEELISQVLLDKTGWEIPVWVRSAETLREIIEHNPYPSSVTENHKQFLVTFLAETPSTDGGLDTEKYSPDTFKLVGDVIYLHTPGGYGKTKLSNNYFESKLKTRATTRNWKTVLTLLAMAQED